MSRRRTTIFLIRWHRRVGLCLAAVVFILAITGIVLNHTTGLGLSDVRLSNELLLGWYGIDRRKEQIHEGFEVLPDTWVSAADSQQLYLNSQAVSGCDLPLKSAVANESLLAVLCADQVHLLSHSGELIESIGASLGLPDNITNIAIAGNKLLFTRDNQPQLNRSAELWSLDVDSLELQRAEFEGVQWPQRKPLPPEYGLALAGANLPSISLETLMLDIHTGRILGSFGIWLMDLATILLMVLAASGCWAWLGHRKMISEAKQKYGKEKD